MHKTARNLTVLGVGLSISAVVGWLLLREQRRDPDTPFISIKSQNRPLERDNIPNIILPLNSLESDAAALTADDLTEIKDIGPQFARALQAIGITSFDQLAQHDPDSLAEKLATHVNVRAQRIRNSDWIGQAAHLAKR